MSIPTRAAWGEAIRGLRLGAALDRDGYSPGEPIDLTISLRNEGGEPVTLVESHLLWEYRILVDLDGIGAVAMSAQALGIFGNLESWYSGARRSVELPPEAAYELPWKAPLHQWFVIDRPGRYAVQVQRKDWVEGDEVLTSGIVRFEVR
jgi:hypothetical protein